MRFRIVIATHKPEGTRLPIHDFLENVKHDGIDVELSIYYGNTSGLPKVYNKAIDNSTDLDLIVFTHDDIHIRDCEFFPHIISTMKIGADVIAAVGSTFYGVPKGFDIDHQPLIWTKASCGHPCSGFMLHTIRDKQGNNTNLVLPSSYGVAPKQILVSDGCFMCFTKKAIQSGLRFDTNLRFHWYDIDCSIQANKLGLKMMTAPILLQHDSMGQSVVQPEFMEAQKYVLNKWMNNRRS